MSDLAPIEDDDIVDAELVDEDETTCEDCGVALDQDDDGNWSCPSCGQAYDVDDEERTIDEMIVDLNVLIDEGEALAIPDAEIESTSTSLVLADDNRAPAVKRQLARQKKLIVAKQSQITAARKAIEKRLEAQMERARAIVGPLQKVIRKLEEGIWTVNLYLGTDEQIVTLLDGDPAPADEPITLRQMVLAMDEECRIGAAMGGLDARGIPDFDEWLVEDPAHLEQVLPERKGIVVLVATRQNRNYKDPWTQQAMDDANAESYWLIRNGDRLFRMKTNFRVGQNLVPNHDEFTSLFERTETVWGDDGSSRRERRPIEPETREWARAEEAADARQRHYMRAALILQGLVDRTTVFHPLPPEHVSFIDRDSYDAGHIVTITDADLALGMGFEPFTAWLARLNAQLRPGMRIIGAFDTEHFHEANYKVSDYSDNRARVSPGLASNPESRVIHIIEERSPNGDLIIRYKRSDLRHGYERPQEIWDKGSWGSWEYQKRASCKLRPTDDFILPFDLVTVDEMRRYLWARTERHNYITLLPLLRSAITAKEAEEEAEAPFRDMLIGILLKRPDVDLAEADTAVRDLVPWFKLKNRHHRPLVTGDAALESKAVAQISAEFDARRAAVVDDSVDAQTVAQVLAEHPDAMFIARRNNGTYVAAVPSNDANAYATRLSISKTGKTKTEEWKLIPPGWRTLTILHTTDRWDAWDWAATTSTHLSDPEIAETAATLAARGPTYAVAYQAARREFKIWAPIAQEDLPAPDRLLTDTIHNWRFQGAKAVWSRAADGTVRFANKPYFSSSSIRPSDKLPWDATAHGSGFVRVVGPRLGYVWADEDLIATIAEQRAVVDTAEAEAGRLRSIVYSAVESLRTAWHDAQVAVEYRRFIDDMGADDPDLWEGHLKTAKLTDFPTLKTHGWRHASENNPFAHPHDEGDIIALVVEAGHDIDGMTLRDVFDLATTSWPNEFASSNHADEDDVVTALNATERAKFLDQVGDMTLHPKPEETDDDDDD